MEVSNSLHTDAHVCLLAFRALLTRYLCQREVFRTQAIEKRE